ncbi:MAG: hypothetical protein AAB393_13320, partial [Bacteroidota bacterium]
MKTRFPEARFVITSRPGEITSVGQVRECVITPPEDPAQCIISHGIPESLANRAVADMRNRKANAILTRPIFLSFVARLLRETPNAQIPSVPGLLMRRVVNDFYIPEMLKHQRMSTDYGLTLEEKGDVLDGLALVAFTIIDRHELSGITRSNCEGTLTQLFERKRRGNPPGDLAHNLFSALKLGGFLEETSQNTFRFSHDMFRDYFAACHLTTECGVKMFRASCKADLMALVMEKQKCMHAFDLLGDLQDPLAKREMIEWLVDRNPYLAARCFPRTPIVPSMEERLIQRLTGIVEDRMRAPYFARFEAVQALITIDSRECRTRLRAWLDADDPVLVGYLAGLCGVNPHRKFITGV